MTIFDTLIPKRAAAGYPPIGGGMPMLAVASLLKLTDGTEWAQSGVGIPYAARYAQAAKFDHLKLFGLTATGTFGGGVTGQQNVSDWACNGAGTLCYATGTSIIRSVDGGKTFTLASLAATFPTMTAVASVVWVGNRFIAVGTSATQVAFAHSADALTWTAGSIHTQGGAGTPQAPKIAVSPTTGTVLATWGSSAAATILSARCAGGAGSTFVSSSMLTVTSLYDMVCTLTGRFVLWGTGGNLGTGGTMASADDGVNFTIPSLTLPTGFNTAWQKVCVLTNGAYVAQHTTDGNYLYCPASNDVALTASWSVKLYPFATGQSPATTGCKLSQDALGRVYGGSTPSSYVYTLDGLVWKKRWTNVNLGLIYRPISTGITMFYSNFSNGVTSGYWSQLDTPEYVGMGVASMFDTGANAPTLYLRIR